MSYLRTSVAFLGLVSAFAIGASPAVPDDPKPAAEESPLRIFHLEALSTGVEDFLGQRLGLVQAETVNDEERPLFGAQSEEPVLPIGTADELVELLKSQVDPESWSSVSGVGIHVLGNGVLLVRQRPEALTAIGAAIRHYEERWLRTVTVEVQAVHLGASGNPSAADLAALVKSEAAGPAVSLTSRPGQRATVFGGRQRSYVQDYDVEVAQKSKAADPIVGVTNVGLSVDIRAVPSAAGDRVTLELQGGLTEWLAASQATVVEGGSVELPVLGSTLLQTSLEVPVGAWVRADGAGTVGGQPGWAFLVRARVNPHTAGPAGRGDSLPVLATVGMGKNERRDFDLTALQQRVPGRMAPQVTLWPSNYTPPEPPELPEPTQALAEDALLDLIRSSVAPDAWEKGSLEARRGTLIATAPDVALLAIERLLGALRRTLLWSVETDAEVLEVPAALDLGGGSTLPEALAKDLDAARADGSAKTLERMRLTSPRGTRTFVAAGRQRSYVRDYEVEIAEDSFIGNPVVGSVLAGAVLDVASEIDSTATGAAITVRFSRSTLPEALPEFSTPWGKLHVPEMRLTTLHTTVDAAFGKTTVVGSTLEGGRRTVLLLTPTLRRSGD